MSAATSDTAAPLQPEGLALAVIASSIGLLTLDTIVVALRLWVRAWWLRRAEAWGWDDTVICLSYMAFVPSAAYSILAASYGVGVPDSLLNAALEAKAAYYLGYWEIAYAVSVNLGKASIALALLRLHCDRRYKIGLWVILVSEMLITAICLITLFAICTPPGAQWDHSIGYCKSYTIIPALSWPFSAVNIITDWSCAIIPYFLLRNLNLRRRTKYWVIVVLAVGGLASTGSIIRVPYLKYYLIPEDRLYNFGNIVVWSQLESGLAIFASCLPSLNKLVSVFWNDDKATRPSGSGDVNQTIGGTPMPMMTFQTKGIDEASMSRTVGKSNNGLSDDNSSRALKLDTLWEHDSV